MSPASVPAMSSSFPPRPAAGGLAAIQIANMVGAKPVAVTRTSAKRQQLLDAGDSAVIATETDDVTASLDQITGRAGVQVIYGALSSEPTSLPVLPMLEKRISIRGYDMNGVAADDTRLKKAVAFISEALEKGNLTPTIDAVFDLANIADAYRHLESNTQFDKVVVTVPNAGAGA